MHVTFSVLATILRQNWLKTSGFFALMSVNIQMMNVVGNNATGLRLKANSLDIRNSYHRDVTTLSI